MRGMPLESSGARQTDDGRPPCRSTARDMGAGRLLHDIASTRIAAAARRRHLRRRSVGNKASPHSMFRARLRCATTLLPLAARHEGRRRLLYSRPGRRQADQTAARRDRRLGRPAGIGRSARPNGYSHDLLIALKGPRSRRGRVRIADRQKLRACGRIPSRSRQPRRSARTLRWPPAVRREASRGRRSHGERLAETIGGAPPARRASPYPGPDRLRRARALRDGLSHFFEDLDVDMMKRCLSRRCWAAAMRSSRCGQAVYRQADHSSCRSRRGPTRSDGRAPPHAATEVARRRAFARRESVDNKL